jgi:hypothetical protein
MSVLLFLLRFFLRGGVIIAEGVILIKNLLFPFIVISMLTGCVDYSDPTGRSDMDDNVSITSMPLPANVKLYVPEAEIDSRLVEFVNDKVITLPKDLKDLAIPEKIAILEYAINSLENGRSLGGDVYSGQMEMVTTTEEHSNILGTKE